MSAEDGVFRSFVRSAFLGCLVFSCFRTHEIGTWNWDEDMHSRVEFIWRYTYAIIHPLLVL